MDGVDGIFHFCKDFTLGRILENFLWLACDFDWKYLVAGDLPARAWCLVQGDTLSH